MLLIASIAAVAFAARSTLAANSCSTPNGLAGECIEKTDCMARGDFYVTGRCPNDGATVLCCVDADDAPCGNGGLCRINQFCQQMGGEPVSGLCEGPYESMCCESYVESPTAPTPMPTPMPTPTPTAVVDEPTGDDGSTTTTTTPPVVDEDPEEDVTDNVLLEPRFDLRFNITSNADFERVMAENGERCSFYRAPSREERTLDEAKAELDAGAHRYGRYFDYMWDADRTNMDVIRAAIVNVSTDTEPIVRENWKTYSQAEKDNVVDAFLCIQEKRADVALASLHAIEEQSLHGGPGFLAGHHAFVRTIEHILHYECGMTRKFAPFLNYLDPSKTDGEEVSRTDMRQMIEEVKRYKVHSSRISVMQDRADPFPIVATRKYIDETFNWESGSSVAVACVLEGSTLHVAPHNNHGWPMMSRTWSPLDLILFTMHHNFLDSLFAAFVARRTDAFYPHVAGSSNVHEDSTTMALFNGQTYKQVWDRVRSNARTDLVDGFRDDNPDERVTLPSAASSPLAELRQLARFF